jgi:hypothetical protein
MRDLQSDFDAVQSAAVEHAVLVEEEGWFGASCAGSICPSGLPTYGGGKSAFVDFIELTCTPLVGGALQTRCALKRDREQYAHPGSFRPAQLAIRQPAFEVAVDSTSMRLD